MSRALALTLLLSSAVAVADPDDEPPAGMAILDKARFFADRGRQKQRDGKYPAAIEAYKAAYVLAPSPGLLFNLAQVYRLNGDCDDAAWMYKRFLDTDPPDNLRDLADDHIAKLQSCMHGGVKAPDAPTVPRPSQVVMEPSQPSRVAPAAPPSLLGEDDPGHGKRRAGTYVMIGGGVVLATAVVFAIGAHSAADDVTNAYKSGTRNPDIGATDDRGSRDSTIATIAGITGGAALVTGAVLYGLGKRDESHVAIVPHANGGEVRLAWQF